MKKRIGAIINYVVIIGTLAFVLIYTFGNQNGSQSFTDSVKALNEMALGWIAICALCYLGNVVCDSFAMWYFLKRQDCPIGFWYCFFVSAVGQFYSYVTPGATGGQPMQVYYLHKRNVPVGLASSALIVRFFSFQFMLQVFGTVLWITNSAFIAEQIGGNMWILIVGYAYNTFVVSMLVLIALKRGIVGFLINLCLKIGVKLHLVKDPEKTREKTQKSVDSFHDSVHLLVKRPADLIVQMLIGAVQLLTLMLVLWFIYLGLHQNGASFSEVLSMNVMEYLSAAYMPTPGASGAQQFTFLLYFGGKMFASDVIPPALLLWRFYTYYLPLIVGIILLAVYGSRAGKSPRLERMEALQQDKERS